MRGGAEESSRVRDLAAGRLRLAVFPAAGGRSCRGGGVRRGLLASGGRDPAGLRGRLALAVGPGLHRAPGRGREPAPLPLAVVASRMARVPDWSVLCGELGVREAGGPWLAVAGGP